MRGFIKYQRFYFSKKFLITGANGQIGRSTVNSLCNFYPIENIIATDIQKDSFNDRSILYSQLDVKDKDSYLRLLNSHKITNIIHFASILSAGSEKNLDLAMNVNIQGVHNTLQLAKMNKLSVFIPSTIATFGPDLEKIALNDDMVQNPTTYYGISKVYMEKLGNYYHSKYDLDFRCLRLPNIITPYEYLSGQTAIFASEIFFNLLRKNAYTMYIDEDRVLPHMYIDDCVRGIIEFINADNSKLRRRVYNYKGLSFSPGELVQELKKRFPNFEVNYIIDDLRNSISKTWPVDLDDTNAKKDWGWKSNISTIENFVDVMLKNINIKDLK